MEIKKEFKLTKEERENLTHACDILEKLANRHIKLPCCDQEGIEKAIYIVVTVLHQDAGGFNPWRK